MKLPRFLLFLPVLLFSACAPVARDDDRGPSPGQWETITPGDQIRARVEFFRYEGQPSR